MMSRRPRSRTTSPEPPKPTPQRKKRAREPEDSESRTLPYISPAQQQQPRLPPPSKLPPSKLPPSKPAHRPSPLSSSTQRKSTTARIAAESSGKKPDCDQIRQRIMSFLDTGEMKVGQFVESLGVSGPGYYRFMKQTGASKGAASDVYARAVEFFARRDGQVPGAEAGGSGEEQQRPQDAGDGGERKRKRKKTESDAGDEAPFITVNGTVANGAVKMNSARKSKAAAPSSSPGVTRTTTKKQPAAAASSTSPPAAAAAPPSTDSLLSTITLPGEPTDSVPIYDTCDEVRRKITAYLSSSSSSSSSSTSTSSTSQASFLRLLEAQYHASTPPRRIQSVQLARFRGLRGPDAGNTSPVFYAAYVLFEKLRIAAGKPKTKMREKMEQIYPNGVEANIPAGRKR